MKSTEKPTTSASWIDSNTPTCTTHKEQITKINERENNFFFDLHFCTCQPKRYMVPVVQPTTHRMPNTANTLTTQFWVDSRRTRKAMEMEIAVPLMAPILNCSANSAVTKVPATKHKNKDYLRVDYTGGV